MSTKNLSDALDLALELIESVGPCEHDAGICVCGERATLDAARAELEAIRKAARDLDDNLPAQVFGTNTSKVLAALNMLAAIALEAE